MPKITVKTKGAGKTFRRAGHVFSNEATEIDSADLTPDQIEQLRAEGESGMLEVTGLPAASPAQNTDASRATRVATTGAVDNASTLGGGHGSQSPSKAEAQAIGAAAATEVEAERHSTKRKS